MPFKKGFYVQSSKSTHDRVSSIDNSDELQRVTETKTVLVKHKETLNTSGASINLHSNDNDFVDKTENTV